ncbi:MAG TPA: MauE/DoxX family redox-associated membrane protein [Steroidobacteraceae bacterium]
MIDPAVGALLAGAFALLFASAALHKFLDAERFAGAFRAYEVVPPPLAWVWRLVPILELVIALALLPAGSRRGAAAAGAALLLAYAGAIAINLGRGRRDLDCGCGGPSERRPIGMWMVWRNVLLAALLAALRLPWADRPLSAVDALTIGAGTAMAALLYMSLDTLFARPATQIARLRGGSGG